MNTTQAKRVLVLGGNGFIGRHVAASLRRHGHDVVVSTRRVARDNTEIQLAFHKLADRQDLNELVNRFDVVINAVGILRQRFRETYQQVHRDFVHDLAKACLQNETRLIHVSALGLQNDVHSRFLLSKRQGEQAIKAVGGDWVIVRPSLIDGDGGYGAKWFRRIAAWPIHIVPSNANALLCPIHVNDLADAIRCLTEKPRLDQREYELGGDQVVGLRAYLALLKGRPVRFSMTCPASLVRLCSHVFDVLHITPLSFGHYELLKRDNVPAANALNRLLGRPARALGKLNKPAIKELSAAEVS